MLIFAALLAFYLAWNLGANDVANSMGTSIGSKAVTLRQALVIAGVLEFTGAVLFGQRVSQTLATQIVDLDRFAATPQTLLLGMVAVLVSCGLWLNLATFLGLPVSSSHAIVGAIAGFAVVAVGVQAVNWSSIGLISLTWLVTPVVSGAIAALVYSLIQRFVLQHPDPIAQLRQWIPWLSLALFTVFGAIVGPSLSDPMQRWLGDRLPWTLPAHDLPLALGAIATVSLTLVSWRRLETARESGVEPNFARFQLLSACFVAFAHGSNDVGNAVAPLAVIVHILQTGQVPLEGFAVPVWVLVLGGGGIVAGLAVWGHKVIATIGEGIIALQPSGGFCAELATATTVLLASSMGLPVSTSHALVGSVVGIGLVQNARSLPLKTLGSVVLAWVVTIPVAAGLAAAGFYFVRQLL
jgi:inorganic phosphate transporter, PiT family